MKDIKNLVGAIVVTGMIFGFLTFVSVVGALIAPVAVALLAVAIVYALFFHEDEEDD